MRANEALRRDPATRGRSRRVFPRDPQEAPMARFIHVVLRLPSPILKFLLYAKKVFLAVTGNPNFPGAGALLGDLDSRIKAMDKALSGTAKQRRAAREALREALDHLAEHVQVVAEASAGTVDLSAIQALV